MVEDEGDTVADLRESGTTERTATPEATSPKVTESMLSEHIPLSLLMDMSLVAGPDSAELLASEGGDKREWWSQDD